MKILLENTKQLFNLCLLILGHKCNQGYTFHQYPLFQLYNTWLERKFSTSVYPWVGYFNTTGVTSGTGTAYPLNKIPEHLNSPPVWSGVRVTRSLILCVCFVDHCLSFFFWPLCFLIYWFWLPLLYLQTLLKSRYIESYFYETYVSLLLGQIRLFYNRQWYFLLYSNAIG